MRPLVTTGAPAAHDCPIATHTILGMSLDENLCCARTRCPHHDKHMHMDLLHLYYHTHLLGSNIFVAILIRLFYFIVVLFVKRSKLGFSHTYYKAPNYSNGLPSVDHTISRCFLYI